MLETDAKIGIIVNYHAVRLSSPCGQFEAWSVPSATRELLQAALNKIGVHIRLSQAQGQDDPLCAHAGSLPSADLVLVCVSLTRTLVDSDF